MRAIRQVRGEVRAARRKGHGLGAVQRGPVLGEAQLHPHARGGPAAPGVPAAAAAAEPGTETADHLRAR